MSGFNFAGLFAPRGGISHSGGGTQVTATPPANPTVQLTTGDGTNVQGNPKTEPKPDPLNSQLDDLKKVWQTPTDAEGKPIATPADPLAQQMFTFKPEDVIAGANKLDFTTGINPELFQKVTAGGDDAVGALKEIMNGVARAAFSAGTINNGNLMNDGFKRHGSQIDAALPTRIRNHQVSTSKATDPILSHPAVQPMFTSMRAVIANNNPGMSAEDVNSMAEQWFSGLGQAMSMTTPDAKKQQDAEKETDWLKFAGFGN